MKTVLIGLAAILASSCSNIASLNERIAQAQVEAVSESPYKDAPSSYGNVDAQKAARIKIFKEYFQDKVNRNMSSDTLFIIESFEAICIGCQSFVSKFLIKDTIYTVNYEVLGHKGRGRYTIEKERFKLGYGDLAFESRNTELSEIVNKFRSGAKWRSEPLEYGMDHCADGDHTFITVVYPDQKIEALYVRCWLPILNRKSK